MTASTRYAQLGLGAVVLVFCLSVGILGFKTVERQRDQARTAPPFTLPDLYGQSVSLSSLKGKAVLLVFWSAHDPATTDYAQRIIRLANRYSDDDRIALLAIDPAIPDPQHLDHLRLFKSVIGQTFPLLIDPAGKTAAAYHVSSLPAVVLIDPTGRIRYRGPFDDNHNEASVQKHYCEEALADLLPERPTPTAFTQAFGSPPG